MVLLQCVKGLYHFPSQQIPTFHKMMPHLEHYLNSEEMNILPLLQIIVVATIVMCSVCKELDAI